MVDCFPMFSGTCAEWVTAAITFGAVWAALRSLDALIEQVTAAKTNAQAALKQAEAITQSERAYVFAKVVLVEKRDEIVGLLWENRPVFNGTLQYRTEFKNYGKTPANIISSDTDNYTITTPEKIRDFSLTNQSWGYPDGLVIAGGLQWSNTRSVVIKEGWEEIIRDKKRFYCIGLIRYRDVFGDYWQTGYCWEYVARHNHFAMCEEATHLNYCRPYNPPGYP